MPLLEVGQDQDPDECDNYREGYQDPHYPRFHIEMILHLPSPGSVLRPRLNLCPLNLQRPANVSYVAVNSGLPLGAHGRLEPVDGLQIHFTNFSEPVSVSITDLSPAEIATHCGHWRTAAIW